MGLVESSNGQTVGVRHAVGMDAVELRIRTGEQTTVTFLPYEAARHLIALLRASIPKTKLTP